MKVDKFIDILLTKGPKAIGHFHSALEFEYPALFEVLSRMFVKAGVTLPPERQIRGIVVVVVVVYSVGIIARKLTLDIP